MSDLFVTTHTPVLGSGRALRSYTVARAMAATGDGPLDIAYAVFGAAEPDATAAAIPGVRFHPVVASRGVGRALAFGRARLAGIPAGFARGASAELGARAAQLARAGGCERVVADGPVAFAALRGLARRRPVIYCAHNLESRYRHTLDAGGLGSRRGLARFEAGVLAAVAESWMASPADMDGAAELCPRATLRYVPNVVDVAAIDPVAPVVGGPVLLVADFSYEPNRNGLRFLLQDVLPLVWEHRPAARALIVGRGLEPDREDDERVELAGFVDDLHAAYARASCAVVPLLEGGGSPLKFVEALAHGLPVVGTPRAAAGLEVSAGEHFLLGDGAEDFAAALVTALDGGAGAVARAGRALAEEHYSVQALADRLAR